MTATSSISLNLIAGKPAIIFFLAILGYWVGKLS
jgi:hypothetical protein